MSEEKNETKFDKILEGYRPMPMGRMFYPRGMKLSEDFVNAFHREYDRLVSEGQNPKSLLERFGKALKFHVSETRKYPQLDAIEEAKKKQAEEQSVYIFFNFFVTYLTKGDLIISSSSNVNVCIPCA